MDNNKKFWNKFAFIYDFIINKDKKAYEQVVEEIRGVLKSDIIILELATGTGIIAGKISPFCKRIEATDFSDEMIRTAKKKHSAENLSFSVADATNLPYPDNSYDVIIISNALHIMPNPEASLDNIKRVLKNDGILIAPTFLRSSRLSERLSELIMKIFGFKTFSKWTYEQYLQFLSNNGWAILRNKCIKASFPLAFVIASNKH